MKEIIDEATKLKLKEAELKRKKYDDDFLVALNQYTNFRDYDNGDEFLIDPVLMYDSVDKAETFTPSFTSKLKELLGIRTKFYV